MKPKKLLAFALLLGIAGFTGCNEGAKTENADSKAADVAAKNIALVKSFYPLFEKGDWAGIEKLTSLDFTDHSPMIPGGSVSSRDTLMKYIKIYKEAFPDMKFEILSIAASGDLVFVQYRFTGTNTAPLMGMPATNKKVDYTGVDLVRIKDSVAVEHWDYGDNITYMKQMGLIPEQ